MTASTQALRAQNCSHPLIGEVASGKIVCRDCGQEFHLAPVTADTAPLLAQLQWIGEAVEGLDVSEFAESFPLIRAVVDLKRKAATLDQSGGKTPREDLKRYDLITNYRCGDSIEEMERNDEDGEWVRYEDIEPLLALTPRHGERREQQQEKEKDE